MKKVLEDSEIEIACRCGKVTKQTIGWVKKNTEFTCTCGVVISIDSKDFRTEMAKVDKSMSDLMKSLKKLGG